MLNKLDKTNPRPQKPGLSPYGSPDRLQALRDPDLDKQQRMNGWMDGQTGGDTKYDENKNSKTQ